MTRQPTHTERWLLAGRLVGLIKQLGYASLREAALASGVNYKVLWAVVHGRQPKPETLRRILEGIGASEADLIEADDLSGVRLSRNGARARQR